MNGEVDIVRVQKVLLSIAESIRDILTRHSIPHFIAYGTLIGAVRHKGFIPWDDDFDFYLFDDTYDYAIDVLRKELPADMFVEDESSEPKYFHGWAHVKDLNSTVYCELFPQDNLYAHHGISVDLYRTKIVDIKELAKHEYTNRIQYLNRKLSKGFLSTSQYSILEDKFKTECRAIDDEVKSLNYDENEHVLALLRGRYVRVDRVMPLRKYCFENTWFWGPENYDAVLKVSYSDYMQLPPEEQRMPHYSRVDFH